MIYKPNSSDDHSRSLVARLCRTTFAPILMNLFCGVVSENRSTGCGSANVRDSQLAALMSAIAGKVDVRELPSECLLIATSGHSGGRKHQPS